MHDAFGEEARARCPNAAVVYDLFHERVLAQRARANALAPLAIGSGAQLMQPLAIAVIGGFVLSGPIVLLVLPGLYRLLDRD